MRWLLALHVVAIISWMAGMLYLWRLYVYHSMEEEQVVIDRLQIMERRLLNYITNPAMIVSLLSGGAILASNASYYFAQPWMHLKLALVFLMFGNHGMASAQRRKLLENPKAKPTKFYRIMNEVPTVLMIGIVIAVIVKPWAR